MKCQRRHQLPNYGEFINDYDRSSTSTTTTTTHPLPSTSFHLPSTTTILRSPKLISFKSNALNWLDSIRSGTNSLLPRRSQRNTNTTTNSLVDLVLLNVAAKTLSAIATGGIDVRQVAIDSIPIIAPTTTSASKQQSFRSSSATSSSLLTSPSYLLPVATNRTALNRSRKSPVLLVSPKQQQFEYDCSPHWNYYGYNNGLIAQRPFYYYQNQYDDDDDDDGENGDDSDNDETISNPYVWH